MAAADRHLIPGRRLRRCRSPERRALAAQPARGRHYRPAGLGRLPLDRDQRRPLRDLVGHDRLADHRRIAALDEGACTTSYTSFLSQHGPGCPPHPLATLGAATLQAVLDLT